MRIRNGEPLPLLTEVLELVGDRDVYVEVKTLPEAHDEELLAVLDQGPAPARYAVHSFDHRIVRRLGSCRAELRRGILLSAYLDDPVAAMRGVGATTLWQEWQQVDQELVNRVHDAGFYAHRLDRERDRRPGADGPPGGGRTLRQLSRPDPGRDRDPDGGSLAYLSRCQR